MRPTLPPPIMNNLSAQRTRSRLTRVWKAPAPYTGRSQPGKERLFPRPGGEENPLRSDQLIGSRPGNPKVAVTEDADYS